MNLNSDLWSAPTIWCRYTEIYIRQVIILFTLVELHPSLEFVMSVGLMLEKKSKNICTPYHRQFLHPLHILESKFKSNYLQCLIWQSLHIKCNKASNTDGILVHYWCSCLHYIWWRDGWWRYTTEPFNSALRIALQIITCINIIIICH